MTDTPHAYGLPYQAGAGFVPYAPAVPISQRSAKGALILLGLFLLPVSLIPWSRGEMFRVPPFPPIWWTEHALMAFCFLVLSLKFLTGARLRSSTVRWLLAPMILLGIWQMISIAWNDRDTEMRLYSFAQSTLMCAAVMTGVVIVSGMNPIERLRFARGLVWLVGGIIAVYVSLSLVFPAWRPSYAYMDSTTRSLGFIRLLGPLGTSTTLNFVLLPLLGVCVGMLFLLRSWKGFWIVAALFFAASVILTGSRGGLLSLAAFCVLLLPALRIRSMVVLTPFSVILLFVILLVGIPERFRSFEDRSRFDTYATAIRAWSVNPETMIFGTGHGALYSKLNDDSLRNLVGKDRWFLLEDKTQFGYTLRNSHSTLMRSLAETGMIGLALQLIPLTWIGFRLLLSRPTNADRSVLFGRCVLAGCAAMVVYMAGEEFFITAYWVTLLWTVFAVIGAETIKEEYAITPTPA